MVFVEVFRLLVVVLGAEAGLQVGEHVHPTGWAPLAGVCLGALVTYVVGGTAGRVLDHGMSGVLGRLRTIPAAEILAAAVVGSAGLLLGLVVGLPALAVVHSPLVLPAVGALAWALCMLGIRLGAAKGRDVARAAGIAHLLDPRLDQQLGGGLVADTSAVMDRHLVVLGRAGLLGAGLTLPRSVVEEVRMLAEHPDPTTASRARRGLDALAALREAGVPVTVVADDPTADSTADTAGDERVVSVASRLGARLVTCSAGVVAAAGTAGLVAVDLRALVAELLPEHPVGQQLRVDLVKPGRLPRQAVGYLPDGDMVVVNDAEAMIGRSDVPVTVSGSRRTSQGQLLFAHLDRVPEPAEAAPAG